jgi:hypothetical protein
MHNLLMRKSRTTANTNNNSETPASVDDHDMYFDTSPQPRMPRRRDERPPPTNPDAVSLASSSTRRGPAAAAVPVLAAPPAVRRATTTDATTNWEEAQERPYDMTAVVQAEDEQPTSSSSFAMVDPWEKEGERRGSATQR